MIILINIYYLLQSCDITSFFRVFSLNRKWVKLPKSRKWTKHIVMSCLIMRSINQATVYRWDAGEAAQTSCLICSERPRTHHLIAIPTAGVTRLFPVVERLSDWCVCTLNPAPPDPTCLSLPSNSWRRKLEFFDQVLLFLSSLSETVQPPTLCCFYFVFYSYSTRA